MIINENVISNLVVLGEVDIYSYDEFMQFANEIREADYKDLYPSKFDSLDDCKQLFADYMYVTNKGNIVHIKTDNALKRVTSEMFMIKCFVSNLEEKIENTEDREPYYDKSFILSFDGEMCRISFGADEYYTILDALKHIIENDY